MVETSKNDFKDRTHPHVLCLFDVDGTLTPARRAITKDMLELLKALKKKVVIGFVGGSDLVKQIEQMGPEIIHLFDFAFSENGLTAYRLGVALDSGSIKEFLGEEKLKQLINFMLHYMADLDIPKKRGTFIEFRKGMLNVSPIGRNCSQEERDEFEIYDQEHGIRKKFVQALRDQFPQFPLTYSIGGQISFDVFPTGWDKTYCLRHLTFDVFHTIHFFGDKTHVGGNDYEIFHHPRITGHTVQGPEDTAQTLRTLFSLP